MSGLAELDIGYALLPMGIRLATGRGSLAMHILRNNARSKCAPERQPYPAHSWRHVAAHRITPQRSNCGDGPRAPHKGANVA